METSNMVKENLTIDKNKWFKNNLLQFSIIGISSSILFLFFCWFWGFVISISSVFSIIVGIIVGETICVILWLKKKNPSTVNLFLAVFIGVMCSVIGLEISSIIWNINKYLSFGIVVFFISLGFISGYQGAIREDKIIEWIKEKFSPNSYRIGTVLISILIVLGICEMVLLRIKREPDIMLKKAHSLGIIYEKSSADKKKLNKAILLYQKVIEKYPDTKYAAISHVEIAEIYASFWIKRYTQTIEEYQKAKEIFKKIGDLKEMEKIDSQISWYKSRKQRSKID